MSGAAFSKGKLVLRWILWVIFGGLFGFLTSYITFSLLPPSLFYSMKTVRELPLPHRIPHAEGALTLRYAMVHDVLLECYRRHSRAWYRRRNAESRRKIEKWKRRIRNQSPDNVSKHDQETLFEAYDNLGVGLERLGQHQNALRVLRNKRDLEKEIRGEISYETYANLGTVLIHAHMKDALRGQKDSLKRVKQGRSYLVKAVELNPDAHFGREQWQIRIVNYLLMARNHPDVLRTYDFVGNRLDKQIPPEKTNDNYPRSKLNTYIIERLNPEQLEEPNARRYRRQYIYRVPGPEDREPQSRWNPEEDALVPFDQPVLAIIGMWRVGGGPNPHFALALGEIMYRIGQLHLAWEAYERAIRMKEEYWPDKALVDAFVEHCRTRQKAIEEYLPETGRESLLSSFNAELNDAREWQKAYQQYERKRIRNGISTTRSDFHQPFLERHGSIATEPGKSDWIRVTVESGSAPNRIRLAISIMVLFAGLFAFYKGKYLDFG